MKNPVKVILIHGNGGGKGTDNWFPYLKHELEKLGVECLSPDFPDPKLARAKYWLPFLKKLRTDENTILIGHSSGAIAAMRWAEENKILGSVLVGAYHTDLGWEEEKKSGYFNKPWNWESIRKNQDWVIIFASTDDPWIPIAEARYLKDRLGAEYYEYDNEGHFGEDKSKTEFPDLLQVLKSKLKIP